MNKKTLLVGVVSALILLATGGYVAYELNSPAPEKKKEVVQTEKKHSEKQMEKNTVQSRRGMEELSQEILVNMNTEKRLNTSMMSQLRAYHSMQKQIQNYAKKVENDIDYIRAIAKDEFQEDVKMQAELYTGKKPKKIAKQLEKFSPFRAGAILAHLKPKEAGDVLDVWAKSLDPAVGPFYKDVMISYLKNKRYHENKDLFDKIKENPASN